MGAASIKLGLVSAILSVAACSGSTAATPAATGGSANPGATSAAPTMFPTSTLQAEPADIIFHHGTVITIDRTRPTAQAVAVKGQQIQAVGSEAEVMAYRDSGTVLVDLQGRTLMPGFEDGHTHYVRNKWGEGAAVEPLMNDLLSFGLTSITEMHSTNEFISAMQSAEREGRIKVHLNIFGEYNCGFLTDRKSTYCPSWYPDNPPVLDAARMVRIPGVKIFVDGAGGDRGCPYMSFEWPSDITRYWPDIWETCTFPHGDLYLTEDELTTVLQSVQDRGYRASFHVMGDAALDVILNAVERVLAGRSNLGYRHQIQHSSTLRPDQLPRYQGLDVLAQVPGYFNTCEAEILEAMYPGDTYTWNTTRYALPGMGVHTYYGGDSSGRADIHRVGSALNPIWGLYGLVTRKQFRDDGTTCDPPEWIGKYKISVAQALEMMTIEPAYAVSMEDYTGSIESGKFADLVILSDNPLTMDPDDLYRLSVWMTMVKGGVGYCADGKAAFCPSSRSQPQATVTATPSVTSGSTQVKFDCDARPGSPIPVPAGAPIQTYIRWGAKTTDQLDEYVAAVGGVVLVDGAQVASRMSHGPVEEVSGTNVVAVQTTVDVGVLAPGPHAIRTQLTFSRKITDGLDWYGPGTSNAIVEGTCRVVVEG